MSSVSDKRTSLEYSFRPSVSPGKSYQDFSRQIPDQAINDQFPQKHSEFKKPYLVDSYQEMDYAWKLGPIPSFPDLPIPPWKIPPWKIPPWEIQEFPIPEPGDVAPYLIPSPKYPNPYPIPKKKPGDVVAIPPIVKKKKEAKPYPIPKPGDDPQYPVPAGTIPQWTMPKVPNLTAPTAIPGDDPSPYPSPVWMFQKCCKGLYLSAPSTAKINEDIPVYYEGGDNQCRYELTVTGSSFTTGTWVWFGGGESGTAMVKAVHSPGTITVTLKPQGASSSHTDLRKTCKSVTIIISGCECGTAHIDYTTQQMSVGGTQTLNVGTPTAGSTYSWTASSGTIGATGDSVTYTAPATNANCANNPTITLKCDNPEVVCDTLQIAVNAYTSGGIAYQRGFEPNASVCTPDPNHICQPPKCYMETCSINVEAYGCNNVLISSTPGYLQNYTISFCLGPSGTCSDTQTMPDCKNTQHPFSWWYGKTFECRTDAMKSDGCCPAQLL